MFGRFVSPFCPNLYRFHRPRKSGKVHSGSPFRELLEDPMFNMLNGHFFEFGAQGNQCSEAHAQYVLSKSNCEIIWLEKHIRSKTNSFRAAEYFQSMVLKRLKDFKIFVSFDIDSIQGADCPGVSCPAVYGLSSAEALQICQIAGKDANVALMDVSEFNPQVESARTARLVVTMFYFFVMGVAQRNLPISNL